MLGLLSRCRWSSVTAADKVLVRLRSTHAANKRCTAAPPKASQKPSPAWPNWMTFTGCCLGGAIFAHLYMEFYYSVTSSWGISMLPTINSLEWLVTNKQYRRGRNIQVGDIVSYTHPIKANESAVKRVIGMPGDFVMRYTPGKQNGSMIQIPEGHCWVVGENLPHSRDSRMFGPLPLALVTGKVIGVWEWSRFPFFVRPFDSPFIDD